MKNSMTSFPWAPVSKAFLVNCGLSPTEKLVLICLMACSGGKELLAPSPSSAFSYYHGIKDLMKTSGFTRECVVRALKVLEAHGFVEKVDIQERPKKGFVVTYRISVLAEDMQKLKEMPLDERRKVDDIAIAMDPVIVSSPSPIEKTPFDLFWAVCPVDMQTQKKVIQNLFSGLSFENQAKTIPAMKKYAAVYASALPADRMYFPQLRSWLEKELFNDTDEAVQRRAKGASTIPYSAASSDMEKVLAKVIRIKR